MNMINKWIDNIAWMAVGIVSSSMWWYWHDRVSTSMDAAYIHERYVPDDCGTWDTLKAMPGNRGHGRTIVCERTKK